MRDCAGNVNHFVLQLDLFTIVFINKQEAQLYTAKTIKSVSVTSLRTAGMHDPIQRVEFVNAPFQTLSTQV